MLAVFVAAFAVFACPLRAPAMFSIASSKVHCLAILSIKVLVRGK
jgi:hypothetical protein